jgi:hypothetical protein
MKLKFIHPDSLEKNLKATVHKTGKLGFTSEAANKMNLDVNKSVGIAIDEDDLLGFDYYLVVYPNQREDGYKVNKSGEYYYINTKAFFDNQKVDYVKNSIVFDISGQKIEGMTVYKLTRRLKTNKPIKVLEGS